MDAVEGPCKNEEIIDGNFLKGVAEVSIVDQAASLIYDNERVNDPNVYELCW